MVWTLIILGSISSKSLVFLPKDLIWQAYLGQVQVRSGKAVGGRRYCPDIKRGCRTPVGEFSVLKKAGRFYRSQLYPVGCPKEISCAPMPFYVKFHYQGAGFHGSDKKLIEHASHGCVRVSLEDAIWINQFAEIGTRVKVFNY